MCYRSGWPSCCSVAARNAVLVPWGNERVVCLSWICRGWVCLFSVLDDEVEGGEGGSRERNQKPGVRALSDGHGRPRQSCLPPPWTSSSTIPQKYTPSGPATLTTPATSSQSEAPIPSRSFQWCARRCWNTAHSAHPRTGHGRDTLHRVLSRWNAYNGNSMVLSNRLAAEQRQLVNTVRYAPSS